MRISVKLIIALIIFSFLLFFLFHNWQKLRSYEIKFNYFYLACSFFTGLSGQIFLALTWQRLMLLLKQRIPFKKALRLYSLSQIGRYIPGKIWLLTGRVYLCSKEGISKIEAFLSIILELILLIISSVIIFMVREASILYLIIIGFCLILIHPKILNLISNIMLRLTKRAPLKITINYFSILKLIFLYIIFWYLQGISFYFAALSIYQINIFLLPDFIAIYSAAWLLSVLTFLSPGGIGIREILLVFFLKPYLPLVLAMAIAILSRIILLISELTVIAIVMSIGRRNKKEYNAIFL